MGLGRKSIARVPGIQFWKLCGSGTGEGFTPVPNTAVYAILATWPDRETAEAQISGADIFGSYKRRAIETWTVFLQATSARGVWSGQSPFIVSGERTTGPLAALTRATIKPSVALQFWRRVPDISARVGEDRNVVFKIGIGEVPFLHQVTFSIWPNSDAMAAFARKDGPHSRAIEAVRAGNWFREELYARFRIVGDMGHWNGERPLADLDLGS